MYSQFDRLTEDLNQGISHWHQAALDTPDGHANNPERFETLGNLYHSRFEHRGELSDIEKAIEFRLLAMSLTPHQEDLPGL